MKFKKITTDQYIDIAKIAGVAVGAFLVFGKNGLLSRFTNLTNKQINETTKKEIKEIENTGVKASFGSSQYVTFADQLYNAVITSNPFNPTDEQTIYRVFGAMNNLIDVLKLIQAFGVRRLEFSTKGAGLATHLQEDLNSLEIAKLNKILADKNINYKF